MLLRRLKLLECEREDAVPWAKPAFVADQARPPINVTLPCFDLATRNGQSEASMEPSVAAAVNVREGHGLPVTVNRGADGKPDHDHTIVGSCNGQSTHASSILFRAPHQLSVSVRMVCCASVGRAM